MERKNFWGDDEDYSSPYNHRYDEPDSDRGASDEGWIGKKKRANSRFRKHGIALW